LEQVNSALVVDAKAALPSSPGSEHFDSRP
jgi:hypothetical protein